MTQRCGFVAVIGAPNAGKSTLINKLVGSKVSIVSPKVQTTRTTVRGIAIKDQSQIIFVDTPGLFTPKERYERAMTAAAWNAQDEADIIMFIVDASMKFGRDSEMILKRMKEHPPGKPVYLVLNKVDKIAPPVLLPMAQDLNSRYDFDQTFMISAEKARGTDSMLATIAKAMPEGPFHYPEDEVSDMPLRLLAAELTREKLFLKLYQEAPHDLTVLTEKWDQREDGSVMIHQVVIVERDSQKGIVLGKGGAMIRAIGEASRMELEEIIEARVHLKLFVKAQGGWREDPEHYSDWGLDFSS